jgi:hypothetical protein
MKITGAIFDMDGTLIDSMDYWAVVATDYLKSVRIEPPRDTDRDYLENGMKSWHERTCPDIPYEEVSKGIYGIMQNYYDNNVSLKDGVKDMLEKFPKDVPIMGNLDPAGVLRMGTPDSVRTATLDIMEKCCQHENFVISSGCDVPPITPWENIDAFFEAVEEYYEKR